MSSFFGPQYWFTKAESLISKLSQSNRFIEGQSKALNNQVGVVSLIDIGINGYLLLSVASREAIGAPQVLISKIARGSGLTNGDVSSYFVFRVKRATSNFLRPHPLLLRRLGVVGQPKFHGRI